jgi:cell pole-organizing protein PopZ
MSQTAKAQEPSMEEILASIRRIIADDDSSKAPVRAPEPAPAPKPAPPVMATPRPVPPPVTRAPSAPPAPPAPSKQDEIDAVLAETEPPKLKPQPLKAPPSPPPAAEVLDLTEAMTTPSFRTIDGASDVIFAERTSEPPEPPRPMAPPPAAPATAMERDLISTATRAAVDNAFNSLANTVLGNNARTLEDLVKEMLRPMLKSWLDDNLPGLVERLVRAEIERVSRGR